MSNPPEPTSDPADRSTPPDPASPERNRAQTQKSPRKRRRWLRWLVVLLVLLVLLAVAIQAVLWSSIPRNLILAALQKTLGVKVEADAVHTGWWGNTRVENVTMTIPLEEQPFVKTGVIRVKHSSLFELVIFGLEIRSLEIDNPQIHLRQSPTGRWNVTSLAEGLGGGSSAPAAGGAAPTRPKLPAININSTVLNVTDRDGVTRQVGPMQLTGAPSVASPDLVWDFTVRVPEQLTVAGRVATGGTWRHEAKLDIINLRPTLAPFVKDLPDIRMQGRWEGNAGDGVGGRLTIEQLSVNGQQARGALEVSTAGGGVTVRPDGLELLDSGGKALVALAGGSIGYGDAGLSVKQLLARGPGIDLIADASFNPGTFTGAVSANWTAEAAPASVRHAGTLTAGITRTYDERYEIRSRIDTNGYLTSNTTRRWQGTVEATAAGPRLDELAVTISTPAMNLTGPHGTLDLKGLVASLYVSTELGNRPGGLQQGSAPGLGVALQSLKLRDTDQLSAQGYFLASKRWGLKFGGRGLPLPKIAHESLGIDIDLAGDPEIVHVRSVRLAADETVVQAKGSYVYSQPEPLMLLLEVNHVPPETDVETAALGGKPTAPRLLEGLLAANGQVTGTVDPLVLNVDGQVQGVKVKLLERDLGDISIRLKGYGDHERLQLWRDGGGAPLVLFGAQWELEAIHNLEQDATTLTVGFKDMPLKEVGKFLGSEAIDGNATGNWAVYVPTYRDVTNQVRAGGKLEVKNLVLGTYKLDSLDAWTVVENGRAGLSPLIARQAEGVFTAYPSLPLLAPNQIEINDLRLERWPLALPPSTYLTLDASAPRVAVSFGNKPAPNSPPQAIAPGMQFESGPISAQARVTIGDIEAGDVRLTAGLNGRALDVTLLTADLFESRLEAKASVPLDEPNGTTGSFMMNDIDPQQLSKLVPALKDLSGTFDMRGAIGPVSGRDVLEPLGASLAIKSRDVWFKLPSSRQAATGPTTVPNRGIQIGDGLFQAQLRLDPKFQLARAVLTDQSGIRGESTECPPKRDGRLPVNTLQVSGGEVEFWGRAVRNENDRGVTGLNTLSSHLRIGFRCLDLNQILQAFKPDDKPVPGLIDGSVVLYGTSALVRQPSREEKIDQYVRLNVPDPIFSQLPRWITPATAPTTAPAEREPLMTRIIRSMQGDGQLNLRNSDLGNIASISFLYNAMRLGADVRQPTGNGRLDFRVENGDAYINAFRYFNRGVEVRAVGTLYDLAKMQEATLRATAYGSVRTLKDVELPLVRSVIPDIEAILAAIQQGGTSIVVRGTVGQPQMQVVLFEELGQSMRELLLGDYQNAQKAPPR